MPASPTARFGFPSPLDLDQINAGASNIRALATAVDAVVTGYSSGVFASRPAAAASQGKIYRATDVLDGGPNGTYYLSDGTSWFSVVLNANKGFTNIATSESRTNTAFGTLTTPDQVTVTLPANGLITVLYQATWSESLSGSAFAALYLDANEIMIAGGAGPTVDGEAYLGGGPPANTFAPLATYGAGLLSWGNVAYNGAAYTADLTTGQGVGMGGGASKGGPYYVFAAAGTYVVSVRFRATAAHTVTVKGRKLWVKAEAFA